MTPAVAAPSIRAATAADLPRLAGLARQFYAASRVLRRFEIECFVAFWTGMLAGGAGVIFLAEAGENIAGVIGGLVYPEPYSGELLAQEFFWYVDEQQRGQGVRLYLRFERWARERGCAEIRMAHLVDSMPEKVARFYERAGYTKVETLYSKRLTE